LRISEAYEHEPILPYQAEDNCPSNSCNEVGTQCIDISAPLVLTPAAETGTVTVTCQGSPSVFCETNDGGTSCTVTVTQRVCVSVPVRYSVEVASARVRVACADGDTDRGCGCGCR